MPMRLDFSARGYCQTCNIYIQTLDMQEKYMIEAGTLDRLATHLMARTLVIQQKIKVLKENP